jgi:hypothetical protein
MLKDIFQYKKLDYILLMSQNIRDKFILLKRKKYKINLFL